MHPGVRRTVQVLRIPVAFALVGVSDLHDELAVLRKLQQLVVRDPRLPPGRTAVSTDPHVALVVDMNAMLPARPLEAGSRSTPGLDEIPGRIENHDRRRRHRGLLRPKCARAMQKPDIVPRVDGEARLIPELEFRRQLWPARINLECRHGTRRNGLGCCLDCKGQPAQGDRHDDRCHENGGTRKHWRVPLSSSDEPAPAMARRPGGVEPRRQVDAISPESPFERIPFE